MFFIPEGEMQVMQAGKYLAVRITGQASEEYDWAKRASPQNLWIDTMTNVPHLRHETLKVDHPATRCY